MGQPFKISSQCFWGFLFKKYLTQISILCTWIWKSKGIFVVSYFFRFPIWDLSLIHFWTKIPKAANVKLWKSWKWQKNLRGSNCPSVPWVPTALRFHRPYIYNPGQFNVSFIWVLCMNKMVRGSSGHNGNTGCGVF